MKMTKTILTRTGTRTSTLLPRLIIACHFGIERLPLRYTQNDEPQKNIGKRRRRSYSFASSSSSSSSSSFRFKTPLSVVEPPIDSSIPERPCTVVLMEDNTIFPNSPFSTTSYKLSTSSSSSWSWAEFFHSQFPTKYGTSFASLSPDQTSSNNNNTRNNNNMNNNNTNFVLVDDVLQEMKNAMVNSSSSSNSLLHHHEVLLVTRGPISSVCAQYYLESNPLLGLIMVDPIPFPPSPRRFLEEEDEDEEIPLTEGQDVGSENKIIEEDENDNNQINRRINNNNNEILSSWNDFWKNQIEVGRSQLPVRPLLLEPNGAVPMLILTSTTATTTTSSTTNNKSSSGVILSRQVAERHSSCSSDEFDVTVPVVELSLPSSSVSEENNEEAEEALEIINDFIDEII